VRTSVPLLDEHANQAAELVDDRVSAFTSDTTPGTSTKWSSS
jgi:hypothetical protein